jgi:hypothetical protein
MVIGNISFWCLFGLGVACLITFASSAYDDFINCRRNRRSVPANKKITPRSTFDSNIHQATPQKFTVRGYDCPELFREDLWLRRIEQAHSEHAALAAMSSSKVSAEAGYDYQRRVCAMLAQHWGTRCDN